MTYEDIRNTLIVELMAGKVPKKFLQMCSTETLFCIAEEIRPNLIERIHYYSKDEKVDDLSISKLFEILKIVKKAKLDKE